MPEFAYAKGDRVRYLSRFTGPAGRTKAGEGRVTAVVDDRIFIRDDNGQRSSSITKRLMPLDPVRLAEWLLDA